MPHPPHDDDNTRKSYETLITHLHPSPPKVLEIDILPSSSGPHIQYSPVDSALGIPKQLLISAFLTARQLFFSYLPSSRSRYASGSATEEISSAAPAGNAEHKEEEEEDDEEIFKATTLLLLLDPNHTTAINFRKSFILFHHHHHHPSPFLSTPSSNAKDVVHAELLWLETLLTSPLPKHTKSPTLWGHRTWLLRRFVLPTPRTATTTTTTESRCCCCCCCCCCRQLSPPPPNNEVTMLMMREDGKENEDSERRDRCMRQQQLLLLLREKELEVVMKAGERHPRNYYGWDYAREMVRLVREVLDQGRSEKRRVEEEEEEEEEWMGRMVERVKRWCFRHPRDVSGWSFLAWLLEGYQMKRSGCIGRGEDTVEGLLRETETFVEKYEWRGESVDWFLKALRRLQGNGR